jgi:bile acid-coenzyme A ligase
MRNIDDPAIPPGGTWPQEPTCEYVGAPPPVTTEDGFVSLGDMGSLDEDGFLHIADRRVDMIVSGGVNVYPAEIESVLSGHPEVADVVVIGVPDPEWGSRVHALVQPAVWPCVLSVPTLDRYCREQLTSYKMPKSYELVEMIPRDPSGKIRRMALREERRSGWTDAMIGTQSTTAGTNSNAVC